MGVYLTGVYLTGVYVIISWACITGCSRFSAFGGPGLMSLSGTWALLVTPGTPGAGESWPTLFSTAAALHLETFFVRPKHPNTKFLQTSCVVILPSALGYLETVVILMSTSEAVSQARSETPNRTSRDLELDVNKLHSLPSEQQDLYLLNFVSDLLRHVEAFSSESLPCHQAAIKRELLKIIGLAS